MQKFNPGCVLLLTLFSVKCSYAQISDTKATDLYNKIVAPYLAFYDGLQTQAKITRSSFTKLFTADAPVQNDYNRLPGVSDEYDNAALYFDELMATFSPVNKKTFDNLQIDFPAGIRELIFCRDTDTYSVWLKKKFAYDYEGTPQVIVAWVRLKIADFNGIFKIVGITLDDKPADADNDNVADKWDNCKNTKPGTTVSMDGCWNEDYDRDGVADVLDSCPLVQGSRSAHGCPDKDNDGIPDDEDKCQYKKGPLSNKGCPISGLVLGVDGGGVLPVGTAYGEENILDRQTYNWLNNSSLASYGLLFNIYLQYHWCTWLGLELGGMNFTTKFDADRLKLNLDVYLMKNKAPANDVSVTSSAYQYNMAYLKLNLGNYKASKWSIKGGPMIGHAFKGFSKNETLIRINYNNGGSQSETLSFRTKPFMLYGFNGKLEIWFSNKVGMTLGAWILTGTNKFETQEVRFANLRDPLRFSSQPMNLAGLSLGLQFLISSGHEYYRY